MKTVTLFDPPVLTPAYVADLIHRASDCLEYARRIAYLDARSDESRAQVARLLTYAERMWREADGDPAVFRRLADPIVAQAFGVRP